jgi:hypothetical protein
MLVDWTDEFQQMLDRLDARSASGDVEAIRMGELVDAQLAILTRLDGEPDEETATLRKVVQRRRFVVWRVSHPFEPGMAVRTIVWFDSDRAVIALLANNKAQMGDVFYDSVGTRADQLIDKYLAAHGGDPV